MNNAMMRPTVLIILDGFGYRTETKYNAIAHAHLPHLKKWWLTYPHAVLAAAGAAVGLPSGMIGNSEVGHLTIGAGRIIDQPIKLWLTSIADHTFQNNQILQTYCQKLIAAGGRLHIIGLLSDAGVHAHETAIYATIDAAVKTGIKKIIVHAILDGRDVPPQSAHHYLQALQQFSKQYTIGHVTIGSIHGRWYAMDRDNNWDRTEKSYRVLTEKQIPTTESWEKILERSYAHTITDEFILPTQLDADTIIHNGDGIIFCNVRPDRARQLTASFVKTDRVHFIVKPLRLTFFITPVNYGDNLNTIALFARRTVTHTLKDVLAEYGKTIFTIAETEKYAHVTYFFRGENEQMVATESRHMIPSLVAENYILHPQMRAAEITRHVLQSLRNTPNDFYLINYANADMVGHSGNFGATIKALEFLDVQLEQLYEQIVEKMNGTMYITADHGKAEDMFDAIAHQPRTGHTTNPVPFLMLQKKGVDDLQLRVEELADVAPFILKNMGLQVPREMERKREREDKELNS
jgi:2,3-bisphosphoglycerate-independent phosphoglycerate mutase